MRQTILIGITGSIAAYKVLTLLQALQKEHTLQVIMTQSATTMLPPENIKKIIGEKVLTELFAKNFDYKKTLTTKTVDHITLADSIDAFLIAPATANVLAKLAHGIADDLLTTTALAYTKPLLIAPAMNTNMWNNPITQENVAKLRSLGHIIIEPTEGMLACGYSGKGKLEDIKRIVWEIKTQLEKTKRLHGKKIIVTAGGTTEAIDDVRVITNKSSGKMGIALAQALFLQGADVLLLRSQHAVKPRYQIPEKTFVSSRDLFHLIQKESKKYDALFHAAAVADFSVSKQKGKLSSDIPHTLYLSPQKKIIDTIKKYNPTIRLFAFKAVSGGSKTTLLHIAERKLLQTHSDAIIVNDIGKKESGFGSDNNEVWIVTKDKTKHIPLQSKKLIAEKIINFLDM